MNVYTKPTLAAVTQCGDESVNVHSSACGKG